MKLFLNLNENIKVKINDQGYQYLADQHNALMLTVRNDGTHTAQYYKDQADKDGYTKMQMHNFMALFGSFCEGGSVVPFETKILIETPL